MNALNKNSNAQDGCLVAQLLGGAVAAITVHVKSEPEPEANGHNHADVEGHDKQHDVVGIKAVQRVQDSALHAVKCVLGSRHALVSRQQERHRRVIIGCIGLRGEV